MATRSIHRDLSTNLAAASKVEASVVAVAYSFTIASELLKNHPSTASKEGKVAGTCYVAKAGT